MELTKIDKKDLVYPMPELLVWWPMVGLDDDFEPTGEIEGGCWVLCEPDANLNFTCPEEASAEWSGASSEFIEQPTEFYLMPERESTIN